MVCCFILKKEREGREKLALAWFENNICSQSYSMYTALPSSTPQRYERTRNLRPDFSIKEWSSVHFLALTRKSIFSLSSFLAEFGGAEGLNPSSSLGSRQAGWQAFHPMKSCPAQFQSWLFPSLSHSLI